MVKRSTTAHKVNGKLRLQPMLVISAVFHISHLDTNGEIVLLSHKATFLPFPEPQKASSGWSVCHANDRKEYERLWEWHRSHSCFTLMWTRERSVEHASDFIYTWQRMETCDTSKPFFSARLHGAYLSLTRTLKCISVHFAVAHQTNTHFWMSVYLSKDLRQV